MRIAIAGFQHETNTFVARQTGIEDFVMEDSWPGLLSGEAVITGTKGMNLPIAGFVDAARGDPAVRLCPLLWCAAEPGGKVTESAFDDVVGRMLSALGGSGAVDAVYLDLHGAMVTERHDDGEGHLLARLRQVVGPDVLLVASLDMHANVTPQMVDMADALTIYRTYPHIDMAETGARAFRMLRAMSRTGRLAKAWRQGDYLVPLHAQQTGGHPARGLYELAARAGAPGGATTELALGFTAADVYDAGPSIIAYAPTQSDADGAADRMAAALAEAERDFDCSLMTPAAAVSRAIRQSLHGPVVIADVQDNPGAGASSDTTGMLRELVAQGAPSTMLGLLHDPALARRAHQHAPGDTFTARIGGRGPGDAPLRADVTVRCLSDGKIPYTGEMYGGGIASLGESAMLQLTGTEISIVVTSIRNQCLDQAHFRHFGLDPATARIVCVKSTAHFRADFEPLAQAILLAAAPGQFSCVPGDVRYRNLRSGVRVGPGGVPFGR